VIFKLVAGLAVKAALIAQEAALSILADLKERRMVRRWEQLRAGPA
jgi:hypothetical protein